MSARLRDAFFICLCFVNLAGAAALLAAPDWSSTWLPWALDPMSRIFLGAVLAATGAAILWIVASGEYAAAAAGSLDLIIAYCGIALYLFVLRSEPVSGALAALGWLSLLSTTAVIVIFAWSSRLSFRRNRPATPGLRILFLGLGLVFLLAGAGLALRWPNAFPWPVDADVAPVLASVVLGAAAYVLHPVLRPLSGNTKAQLLSLAVFACIMLPALAGVIPTLQGARLPAFVLFAAVCIAGLAGGIGDLLLGSRAARTMDQPPGAQNI